MTSARTRVATPGADGSNTLIRETVSFHTALEPKSHRHLPSRPEYAEYIGREDRTLATRMMPTSRPPSHSLHARPVRTSTTSMGST